jgi:hypothetical protein
MFSSDARHEPRVKNWLAGHWEEIRGKYSFVQEHGPKDISHMTGNHFHYPLEVGVPRRQNLARISARLTTGQADGSRKATPLFAASKRTA